MLFVRSSCVLALLLICASPALAAPVLNYDPLLPPPPPILNAGWAPDQIGGAWVNSVDSPYPYVLLAPAFFSITDDFVMGDTYTVFDFGFPILVTANWGPMPPMGGDPVGWLGAGWAKGQVLLGVGPHNLTVQGPGGFGFPAGFFARIDTVPEPSTLALLGVGCGALYFLRRRG